eukprot:1823863-Amphidinium_carterae.1
MFGNDRNPAEAPSWTNFNWLKSRFHFSFAEYHNGPGQYGVLRVMNDDLVQPARELTHTDSMGTSETLGRGSVQFMTAGHG